MTPPYTPFSGNGRLDHLNAWNAPRPSKAGLESILKSAPNREVWLEAKKRYLEETDETRR